MDIIICFAIISILTVIKGIARSESFEVIKPVKVKSVNIGVSHKEVDNKVEEMRNIDEEIDVLGEDIMNIINE